MSPLRGNLRLSRCKIRSWSPTAKKNIIPWHDRPVFFSQDFIPSRLAIYERTCSFTTPSSNAVEIFFLGWKWLDRYRYVKRMTDRHRPASCGSPWHRRKAWIAPSSVSSVSGVIPIWLSTKLKLHCSDAWRMPFLYRGLSLDFWSAHTAALLKPRQKSQTAKYPLKYQLFFSTIFLKPCDLWTSLPSLIP